VLLNRLTCLLTCLHGAWRSLTWNFTEFEQSGTDKHDIKFVVKFYWMHHCTLNVWFRLSLITTADSTSISRGSVAKAWWKWNMTLTQIYCRVCQWNKLNIGQDVTMLHARLYSGRVTLLTCYILVTVDCIYLCLHLLTCIYLKPPFWDAFCLCIFSHVFCQCSFVLCM